ncbi:MAG: winged helix-turn-helix transcriptional regulator [Mucilaginibacter sp.]|nr:winged helix-turn-helix transcriptional regulator [Mucilaginibacter sp.]
MDYIGGKWKMVILHYLRNGKLRYSELRKLMPLVTERTLSLQLKQLEDDGLVKRKVYTSKPPLKVEYALTSFGETLKPLLEIVSGWGQQVASQKATVVSVAGEK